MARRGNPYGGWQPNTIPVEGQGLDSQDWFGDILDDIGTGFDDLGESFTNIADDAESYFGGESGQALAADAIVAFFENAYNRSGDITAGRELIEDLEGYLADAEAAGKLGGEQSEATYERLMGDIDDTYDLATGQAEGRHEFNVKIAEQRFWDLVGDSLGNQGESRRRANQQVLGRALQGDITRGEAASQLAQSSIRKTGSASNLIGENMRMLDIDLGEMDKQLSSEMAKYGRQRDKMRGEKQRAVGGSRLNMEQSIGKAELAKSKTTGSVQDAFEIGLESIVGGLDMTEYFAGNQSFLDLMGGEDWHTDTLLTQPINRALGRARENQAEYFDSGWDIITNIWGEIGRSIFG